MHERLRQLLAAENLTQAQLASLLNVGRANISHILADRNKPGYDFIAAVLECFPNISPDWLILGKGKMYRESTPSGQQQAAYPVENELFPVEEAAPAVEMRPSTEITTTYNEQQTIVNQRGIKKITVFFDDGTYQDLQ